MDNSKFNDEEFFILFYNNFKNLCDRINRLEEIEKDTLDHLTYYEIILVQIRALFIESERDKEKNITVQKYLIQSGHKDIVDEIESFLNLHLSDNLTLRKAIKTCVDKFIVHYDNTTEEDYKIKELCYLNFTDKSKVHIGSIIKELLEKIILGQIFKFNN